MKALAGLGIVAAHVAAFALALARCDGTELAVEVHGPLAASAPSLHGTVPEALRERVRTELVTPPGPGLQRRTWSVRYRGGFERSVGTAQLVGPFQDPEARACVGRVVVSQRLLDDGRAGPGTVAAELVRIATAELAGTSLFPAGELERISNVSVRWAQLDAHPADRGFVGDAPHGYVRAELTVELERVSVPVTIALVPSVATTELGFRIATRARLAFDNRAAQWVSDRLGGNRFATRIVRGELEGLLVNALAPPPPLALPGGHTLRFGFCAEPPEIVDGESGALPFTIELERAARDPSVLPPRRGRAPRLALADGAALAIDLDLDALNALLYELWRGGYLDRGLAAAGLDRAFNDDPTVRALLSLRIAPPRLTLPPVVAPSPEGLRLSAEAQLAIRDGSVTTSGRVWGGLDFTFGRGLEPVTVELGALELACEPSPRTLVPCYADLVAAMRARAPEFHGVLTSTFAAILDQLFVERRVASAGLPAELVIRAAVPRLALGEDNASLHLDLEAALHSTSEPR